MNSIVSLLAVGLTAGLVLMLVVSVNGAPVFDEREMPLLVKGLYGPAQAKALDKKYGSRRTNLMPISQNLTQEQREEFSEICVGIGLECLLAEHCCTMMCLQYYKRCTYVSN